MPKTSHVFHTHTQPAEHLPRPSPSNTGSLTLEPLLGLINPEERRVLSSRWVHTIHQIHTYSTHTHSPLPMLSDLPFNRATSTSTPRPLTGPPPPPPSTHQNSDPSESGLTGSRSFSHGAGADCASTVQFPALTHTHPSLSLLCPPPPWSLKWGVRADSNPPTGSYH